MSDFEEELWDELTALKAEERKIRRLLQFCGIRPPRGATNYSTAALVEELVTKVTKSQLEGALKRIDSGRNTPQINALFELAMYEYAKTRDRLPGRPDLVNFAQDLVRQLGLNSSLAVDLSDHRAKAYLAEFQAINENFPMNYEDFRDLPAPDYLIRMAKGK